MGKLFTAFSVLPLAIFMYFFSIFPSHFYILYNFINPGSGYFLVIFHPFLCLALGNVARMEEGMSAFKILTGKPTGKRPLGRPRRRREDNIRMDLVEIGINAGNWVDSAQDRNYWRALVNAALNIRVP